MANGEESATSSLEEVTFLAESVYRELENAGYDRECMISFAKRVLELVKSASAETTQNALAR